MTSPTNRDARERLAAFSEGGRLMDIWPESMASLEPVRADLRALLSPDEVEGMGSSKSVVEHVAALLIKLEDNMLRNDADMRLDRDGSPSPREMASMLLGRPLTDEEEGFSADQPLPSVATGHPEQGALLSGEEVEAIKKAAYRQGWNDREDDFLLGVARLGAPCASTTDASQASGTNNKPLDWSPPASVRTGRPTHWSKGGE